MSSMRNYLSVAKEEHGSPASPAETQAELVQFLIPMGAAIRRRRSGNPFNADGSEAWRWENIHSSRAVVYDELDLISTRAYASRRYGLVFSLPTSAAPYTTIEVDSCYVHIKLNGHKCGCGRRARHPSVPILHTRFLPCVTCPTCKQLF